jgi:hypothetical protein
LPDCFISAILLSTNFALFKRPLPSVMVKTGQGRRKCRPVVVF